MAGSAWDRGTLPAARVRALHVCALTYTHIFTMPMDVQREQDKMTGYRTAASRQVIQGSRVFSYSASISPRHLHRCSRFYSMARFSATVSIFIDPHQAGTGRAPQTGADAASGDEACHVGRRGRLDSNTKTTWQSSDTDPQTLGIYSGDQNYT